ncbi:unnamed protein product [Euphydryas editha]|uniref:FP protein C-terminal domain-containing protein n=1 Tax=Euphydryas editha TaxID=104508 RepID=A0AAU9TWW7_EUPED|nr:unnamed protein product [Euphydryas editha]
MKVRALCLLRGEGYKIHCSFFSWRDVCKIEPKSIKNELLDLKTSCEFNSAKIDEFENKLTWVEVMSSELQGVNDRLNSTTKDIIVLMQDNTRREQWVRLNNVEIKGVQIKKDGNLFSILENLSKAIGYQFPKTQINYVARVPTHNPKSKHIIVSFINRYIKDEFMAAARLKKKLSRAASWDLIHVRKNDTSPVHIIGKESDLNKIL